MKRRVRVLWLPTTLAALSSLAIWQGFLVSGAIATVIFVADAWGRHRDYTFLSTVRDIGSLRRYFYLWRGTACGRQVMIALDPFAKDYYRALGYRWWHILPDKTFTKDSPFLSLKWWYQLLTGSRPPII